MGYFTSQHGLFNSGGTRPMTPEVVYITKPYDEEGDPQLTGLFLINQDCERIKLVDTLEDFPAFLNTVLRQIYEISCKEKRIAKNDL